MLLPCMMLCATSSLPGCTFGCGMRCMVSAVSPYDKCMPCHVICCVYDSVWILCWACECYWYSAMLLDCMRGGPHVECAYPWCVVFGTCACVCFVRSGTVVSTLRLLSKRVCLLKCPPHAKRQQLASPSADCDEGYEYDGQYCCSFTSVIWAFGG